MAEPTIQLELNSGSEGTPTWGVIGDAARWVGAAAAAGSLAVPLSAPVGDDDEVFYDNAAAPNDGELWNDTGTDLHCTLAGRNTNQNVLRALETGATDGTSDPPEFTAYDDASDAGSRTAPTVWILAGTTGSSNVSLVRAIETTTGAPGAGWTGQVHDATPSAGTALDGDSASEACATALAASGNKTFNLAVGVPHDATPGLTSWVYALQYTYE